MDYCSNRIGPFIRAFREASATCFGGEVFTRNEDSSVHIFWLFVVTEHSLIFVKLLWALVRKSYVSLLMYFSCCIL